MCYGTNMDLKIQSVPSGGAMLLPPTTVKKQISPAKLWCFVLNNYTEEEQFQCSDTFEYQCTKAVFSHEVGASGTPHLQGFCRFKKKIRPSSLQLSKRIHWEKVKGSVQENYDYCVKDGEILYSKGFPKPVLILQEDELYDWQLRIRDLIHARKENPNDREIFWFYEKIGNFGKTVFCKYLCKKYGGIVLSGKGSDMRNGCAQYFLSKSDYPELILINFPRSKNSEYFSYEALENLKDAMFYSGKYEGTMVIGNCPIIMVFANEPPDEFKLSPDRWNIINLRDWEDSSPLGSSAGPGVGDAT